MTQRKFLTEKEVELMIASVPTGKHCIRDKCMLLMCFVHGLRVSELAQLRVQDVKLEEQIIYISRLKNGLSVQHPLQKKEAQALKNWMRRRSAYLGCESDYLFLSMQGKKLSRQQLYRIFSRAGKNANVNVEVHPHMFRHACGYALANRGCDTRLIQDYLGHRNIQNTVIYTAANAARFKMVSFG